MLLNKLYIFFQEFVREGGGQQHAHLDRMTARIKTALRNYPQVRVSME